LYMPSRMAIVADYTPVASRIRVYSIMNLAFPLGSLISPTLAGLLENAYGWNAVFYVATVLHGIGLVPCLFLPPPPKHEADEQQASSLEDAAIDLAFVRSLLPFFLLNLLIGLGMGTVGSITPIYLTDKFQVSTAEVGLFLSVGFGLMTILTQIPAGIVADKFGRRRFITACLGVMPLFFLIWNFVDSFLLLLPIQMAINGLWSMTWPAFISLLMEHVPRGRRGVSSGLTQTGLMLGFTVGPIIGGALWETLGKAFPYYASALFFAFCIPILHFLREAEATR
jgi:MFS family permease